MDDTAQFRRERVETIAKLGRNTQLQTLSTEFLKQASDARYMYQFDWLGLPIIQLPQDIVALQEIIWATKPDIIIETGIARGGSLIFSASMLHLLNGPGRVIGIDIDIRPHNRNAVEAHPLAFRIDMLQGSSIDPAIVAEVQSRIPPGARVMVMLDSNHTHAHVLAELQHYAPLVTKDCYLVVMDTSVEDLPAECYPDRPWGPGDNPKTAVHAFLKTTDRFEIDAGVHQKLLVSFTRDGYLRCLK